MKFPNALGVGLVGSCLRLVFWESWIRLWTPSPPLAPPPILPFPLYSLFMVEEPGFREQVLGQW